VVRKEGKKPTPLKGGAKEELWKLKRIRGLTHFAPLNNN